jgi:hypothetical protein
VKPNTGVLVLRESIAASLPHGFARALSTIRNNRLVVVIVMTATSLTIPECGVSRNGETLTLPVKGMIKNGMSAVGVREFHLLPLMGTG